MRKKGGKVPLKSREWVMVKKERRRRQGKGYALLMVTTFHLMIVLFVTEMFVLTPSIQAEEENLIFEL